MRVKILLNIMGVFIILVVSQVILTGEATAGDINFGQKIIPVNFVYLNEQGIIGDVWSNVTQRDELYALKFFNENKEEVPSNTNLLVQFIEKNEIEIVEKKQTQHTQFIEKNDILEEIKTIV